MANIIAPSKWVTKPPAGSTINWGHPLAQGLVWTCNPQGSIAIPSLIDEKVSTFTNGRWQYSDFGLVARFSGSNFIDSGVTALRETSLFADSAQRFTVRAWFRSPGTGTVVGKRSATNGDAQFTSAYVGTGVMNFRMRGGLTNPPWTGIATNVWHHVVVTWDGTTGTAYCDNQVPVTMTIGTAAEETSQRICVGAINNGTSTHMPNGASVDGVLIYARSITPAEIQWLKDEPYVFIQRPAPYRRFFIPQTAGATFNAAWAGRASHIIGGVNA